MLFPITEHVVRSPDHTTFHLACGAVDAPLIVFVHGWPELSISWRHQLPVFAALGFRAIAPDMRGYGRSSIHPRHQDYAVEHAAGDLLALLGALGRERAVWVGHDWGSPVVWALAAHHPERCAAVANLCVPYFPRRLRARIVSAAGRPRNLSGRRVPCRAMGLPAVLRGEFCPRPGHLRTGCRGDGARAVSPWQPRRGGKAGAYRPRPPRRRLVRRRRSRARRADGPGGAHRGGLQRLRGSARAQWLLRSGLHGT